MSTTNKFKGKAVDMLTACQTITEQAIANKEFLIPKRSTWADPFFDDHLGRINSAFTDILGIDNTGQQRRATQLLLSIQSNAYAALSVFKVQVEQDFKKDPLRRNEILKSLGFANFAKAREGQEYMVQLLFQFKNNLTPELKTEIAAKGTSEETMDAIVAYADQLSQANITQETFKGSSKVLTKEVLDQLNGIYDDTIAIAAIARKFFKGNAAKQDLFSYSKTVDKLKFTSHKTPNATA